MVSVQWEILHIGLRGLNLMIHDSVTQDMTVILTRSVFLRGLQQDMNGRSAI